jgi:nicotinamide-nucleotide adenylyltransferase
MKALFIGRFQPFHNGHLKIIQNISEEYDEVIIGIGSSQYDHTLENPFSLDERKTMIIKTLEKNDVKNYKIVIIPDIHNPPKWVDHVTSIISDFDIVISNSSLTKRLFSEKGYLVKETPLYNRKKYSGEKIRKQIINNESWEKLVPDQVYKIINDINGEERLKKLSK